MSQLSPILLIVTLKEVMRFVMPLLIVGLVQYIDGSGQTSLTAAYAYLTVISAFTFVMIPLEAYSMVYYLYVAMAMRATCSALIYKKVICCFKETFL